MASLGGVLAPEATYGLGLRDTAGRVRGVVWPFGYSARRESGGIVLIDTSGRIVAREGDRIRMAGGTGDDGVKHPCDPPVLEVVP